LSERDKKSKISSSGDEWAVRIKERNEEEVDMQETMQLSIGETIRQMRRQQSLTQTELGGERFSKSYVSAIERDKIVPSYEALHFFAEQLGHHTDYFERFLLQAETMKSTPMVSELQVHTDHEQLVREKVLPLLDILLEGTELYSLPCFCDFPPLTSDAAAKLSSDVQGRYAFLLGLIAQQKEDFSTALNSLELALSLAPLRYRPAILDALGTNYYYTQSYSTALDYHKRALGGLRKLEDGDGVEKDALTMLSALRLKVEFHCGSDYYALGVYKQAREQFEQARQLLRSTQDIKTAAQLYLKLGYSTYADVYHSTALMPTIQAVIDEIEGEFQRAINYFVQSRTLYQVSSGRLGEARARLSQAMVLLDLSTRRRQAAQEKAKTTGKMPSINSASLLDEAEEQCRQILLTWEPDTANSIAELETPLYTALAYFIRVVAQRATIAQLNEYTETATRERSVAVHLCQHLLDTLGEPAFPWALVHNVVTLTESSLINRVQGLLRIPQAALHSNPLLRQDMTRAVVLFAAGEVAEMLGHAATRVEYAETCYECANQSFQEALKAYRLTVSAKEQDASHLYQVYQRCINLLQERKQIRPEVEEKTNQMLLRFLKDALQTSYAPVL